APGQEASDPDDVLACALAAGLDVTAAARAARVHRSTAHRRLADPKFREKVHGFREQMVSSCTGLLAATGIDAVAHLGKLMKRPESQAILLAVCRTVLEFMYRSHGEEALQRTLDAQQARIEELEKHVNEHLGTAGGGPGEAAGRPGGPRRNGFH